MITTGIDKRVKVQQIIENQIPEFLLSESPKSVDFLKQYYISQEYQGGTIDLTDNLDQYIKLDNLTPEVIVGETKLTSGITTTATTVNVSSTKGFPKEYGLFKIGNEVVTYTGITTNSFTGCIRGFSGITTYHAENDPTELVFTDSSSINHDDDSTVVNLSALFLKEFYKKTKKSLTPGLEDVNFVNNLDVSNFIKNSKSLYQSKGTEESFRILFNVLYNESPTIVDLEKYLIKPSTAEFIRREIVLAEAISGNPSNLVGQTIIKSTDNQTRASISEIEPITRKGNVYYKIGLFVGFNDVDLIEGTFNVSPKTKCIESVSIGSSVITVDSTVGFGSTGIVVSGINTNVYYSSKSLNQFFGCENIVDTISTTDNVRSDEFYYGYENGDLTKKVELRLTGVLSKFVSTSDIKLLTEGEIISVKNVGEKIKDSLINKTKKEIFANSWIYNTSSRFQIGSISGSNIVLLTRDIDKSSIKVGDVVEILFKNEENKAATGVVANVNQSTQTVNLDNLTLESGVSLLPDPSKSYDLRRVLKKAISSTIDVEFGNNVLTSDVTNVYNESNTNFYTASNSLPSYQITATIPRSIISNAIAGVQLPQFGYDANTLKYNVISFPSPVPFITGDEIFYTAQGTILTGLVEGPYFVEVLSNSNQIRLYKSRSFIPIGDYEEFEPLPSGSGTHTFSLTGILNQKIGAQRLFRKFPLEPNNTNSISEKTIPGPTGLLINGVEILNYKSENKIFFGPLDKINLLNGGSNYDIITPPPISIASPGVGNTTALIQPVVIGEVTDIQVEPQNFDIQRVLSATIEGGNGSGSILEPIISKRKREISFDGRLLTNAGGVDTVNETITFFSDHNISSGLPLTYDQNGNNPLGVSTVGNDAVSAVGLGTTTLVNKATYYPEVINSKTIKLFQKLSDYNAGINTVGFTTIGNTGGIHIFKLKNQENTLKDIRVLDGGSNYQNRQLFVKPVGINTIDDSINFENHGFNSGDKIVYSTAAGIGSTQPQSITGLSTYTGITTTSNFYQVLKINDNSFKISNAGLGGTSTNDYDRFDHIKLSDQGTGFQVFKYPNIVLNLKYELKNTSVGIITATPLVRGSIEDIYLYEKGSGYGSNILNLEKTSTISVKTGKNAELKPIVSDGKISYVQIQSKGQEYSSAPDLEVVGIGTGLGAKLKAVISDGKIQEVVILESGLQYQQDKVNIKVTPVGSGVKLESSIRGLHVNNFSRYGNEALIESQNKLQYSIVGYSTQIGSDAFGDDGVEHSPIIGWAYDGNPIYGPYGYSNAEDETSTIRILNSGYILDQSTIQDRPSFSNGFFVDDYIFNNSGDLDIHNGRYCRTPDYPKGIYAYFVGIATNSLLPVFPYFIGDSYRAAPEIENYKLNQTLFNIEDSKLIRNTYPYKVSDQFADNDFIVESNEISEQQSIIESTSFGSVNSIQIINSGENYEVGDTAVFDNTNTNGGGLSVSVNSILGKNVTSVETTIDSYQNTVFVSKDSNTVSAFISTAPSLNDGDIINISGLSTTSISGLVGSHKLGISTASTIVYQEIPNSSSSGIVTDIYVTNIPDQISVGSSIGIGTEKLLVLNRFTTNNILRVRRGNLSGVHTVGTRLSLIPNLFDIPLKNIKFNSKLNDVVYFNPHESIGVGTVVGLGSTALSTLGDITNVVPTPTYSIFLPNHPFKTNQRVTLTKPAAGYGITVSKDDGVTNFTIPKSGTTAEDIFIIRKSKDYIGIVTQVGLTTSSIGLAFFGDTKVGSSSFEYNLSSNFDQVTGTLERIHSKVSVSTSHNLTTGDLVDFNVVPNQSVGIGTSVSIDLKYDTLTDKILVNPVTCPSSGITTASNQINIVSHNFKTGDKVRYESASVSEGLINQESYYVYRVDDNNFKLGETLLDVTSDKVIIVELSSQGGTHEFSLINPQINVLRNNNLVFGVGHTSLQGFKFKLFYDKDFKNEFVATGKTDTFQVAGVGTIGITSTATFTLSYSDFNPENLFYNVQKSGYISTADTDVNDYSLIKYHDSTYNGDYSIFGIGSTSFSIALPEKPEKLSYIPSETDLLNYTTKSTRASGSINDVKINFGGVGYKSLPSFVSIASTQGTNASLLPDSTTINKLDDVRILNPGFEYSSDNTLKPEAFVSPVISIINSNTISNIEIIDGGKNYTSIPDLVIVNPTTGIEDTSGAIIDVSLRGTSLQDIEVVVAPKGLDPVTHSVFTLNNTNGSTIKSVGFNSGVGIVTCTLVTPILGFSTAPFTVGEEIFVEGIQKYSNDGTGFNSNDNGFKFFTVTSMVNNNPATVEFNVSGITTNAGIAKTSQNSYAQIIKKSDYPSFKVTQKISKFNIGEKLSAFIGDKFTPVELRVSESTNEFIKITEAVPGAFDLVIGQRIRGFTSGNIATINTIVENTGQFEISYSLRQDQGWKDDVGKLNQDYQLLPDNDYYQNLSYTVKSSILYEDLINPVNRLLHTSGLKNFADVGITSSTSAGVTTSTFLDILALDFVDQKRVDTINNFDFALDIDTVNNKSKFLKLQNTKLSPYIECRTNRVLEIDDISGLFSNTSTSLNQFLDLSINAEYVRFLVQIRNPNNKNTQLSDIVLFKDANDVFTAEQAKIHNTPSELGELKAEMDSAGLVSLKFTPDDPENNDYDLKIFKSSFNTNLAGIGTQSIGFVNLSGSNAIVATASTSEIISSNTSVTDAFFASVEVHDPTTEETNFVQLYLTHDGTNTYMSEFFTDSEEGPVSNFIGTFKSSIDSGVLSLDFENNEVNEIRVRSNIIGIGKTTSGIGTYRFKSNGQIDGSERTVRFESNYANVSAATTVATFLQEEISSLKGIVRVSSGSTSALHQVLVTHNETDTHNTQYPFLSIGSTSGIGTFSSTIVGNDLNLNFHPDPLYSGGTNSVQVQVLTKAFYTDIDLLNIPLDLQYGTATESLSVAQYDAINGSRANKTSFPLQNNTTPIFQKNFDPSNASTLNQETGEFTITNHFFETGEKLIYKPGSTFTGASVAGIATGGGTFADGLEVFAIKSLNNKDKFKIAKSRPDALAGIAVTFTGVGSGNNHEFEMSKKNEKALLSIDGIIQSPIAFTPVSTNLEYAITNSSTTFSVTGISSVNTGDTIKVNDEYMKITNVGLGTTSVGPITESGNVNILVVERGYIGSAATNHSANDVSRLYSGGYNIVDNNIHFTEAPRGTNSSQRTVSNLDPVRSTFTGRVYLRQDYSTNQIFDDISEQFTGIDQNYRVKVGGADTVGINTGSSILLLNGIFQTPTTFNNLGNNYNFAPIGAGTSTNVVFTGITSSNGSLIISDSDVNQNQLPRGGVIVSLGSTGGLGVAPLGPAKVKASINGSGAIVGFVGLGTTGSAYNISTASYNNTSGELEITTSVDHDFGDINEFARLDGLIFTPSLAIGINTSFGITGIASARTFSVNVGTSAQTHTYVGSGTAFEYLNDLSFGSGYRNPVSVAVTDLSGSGSGAIVSAAVTSNTHVFVSAATNSVSVTGGLSLTPTNATYDPATGDLVITKSSHGLTTSNTVGLATNGFVFRCAQDNFSTDHAYPRSGPTPSSGGGDPAHSKTLAITSKTTNTFTVNVGITNTGTGGVLQFTINNAGTGYTKPRIIVEAPSYSDLAITGVSRRGIGSTTDTGTGVTLTLDVGAATTTVGIGSTSFKITNFELNNSGYNFKIGDVFKPVGLVTDRFLNTSQLISDFELTVTDVFNDQYSSWNFGQFDFIDSIKDLQDGQRTRFPLIYNANLLSFETDPNNPQSSLIDLKSLLLIFINGVVQDPGEAYSFDGGTSFEFTQPPEASDVIDIFFYKGTEGVDAVQVSAGASVAPTIKTGDSVQVFKTSSGITTTQDLRTIFAITASDEIETNLYNGIGIDERNFKPFNWTKQKVDKKINGEIVYKTRDSIESLVYPTANIIGDVGLTTTILYLDNASFFRYEQSFGSINIGNVGGLIVGSTSLVAAGFTATVSIGGTVQALTITNGGSGYVGSTTSISISAPHAIGVGVGTTAVATASITNGVITSTTITNPGFGYTISAPPQVIAPFPSITKEDVDGIAENEIQGFDGDVIAIGVTDGVGGNPLALKFTIKSDIGGTSGNPNGSFTNLKVGTPIYIFDTQVGHGVTSVFEDGAVVATGTTCVDNVYIVNDISGGANTGIITCNIMAGVNTTNIDTAVGVTSIGAFSWGKLSGITRSGNPISIGVTGMTLNSGLSTYPTIQRRDFGLRDSGALRKDLG